MSDSPFVMVGLVASPQHREPLTAQLDKNADSEFWFYTTKDNRIAQGGPALVEFVSKDHKVFASISGVIREEKNPAVIDKYWSKQVAAWYDQGRDDPNLCMLKFELDDAEVWTVDASLKGLFKLFTGKKVDPEEMGSHRKMSL